MRLMTGIFIVTAITTIAGPAAAVRLDCAIDDSKLKMSLETEFGEDDGGELRDFRGVMAVVEPQAPRLLVGTKLTSGMLTQSFAEDASMRMRLYMRKEDRKGLAIMDMVLKADTQSKNPGWIEGAYTATAQWRDYDQAQAMSTTEYSGRLSCRHK